VPKPTASVRNAIEKERQKAAADKAVAAPLLFQTVIGIVGYQE
jgi:hypothetical protein